MAVGLFNGLNWSTIELAVAIICACVPCYGPLIPTKTIAKTTRLWSSSRKSKASSLDNTIKSNTSQQASRYNRLGDTKDESRYLASVGSDSKGLDDHDQPYPLQSITVRKTVEVV